MPLCGCKSGVVLANVERLAAPRSEKNAQKGHWLSFITPLGSPQICGAGTRVGQWKRRRRRREKKNMAWFPGYSPSNWSGGRKEKENPTNLTTILIEWQDVAPPTKSAITTAVSRGSPTPTGR